MLLSATKMRRDKMFARILLILSIANVVLAAPALVRQRRFVTDRSDDESMPLLAPNSDASESSVTSGSVTQASPPSSAGAMHQDSPPVSVAPQLNNPQPVSGTSELHNVPPPYVPPFTSGNPPSQDDAPPASEAAQFYNDPFPGSGSQPLHDDIHPSWHAVTEIEQVAEPDEEVNPKALCGLRFHCWDWDPSQVLSDWDLYKWHPLRSFE